MVYGVRNNTTVCYYKDFLIRFFKARPDSTLYLACSRDILDEDLPSNVHTVKGYVQTVLSKFDLKSFKLCESDLTTDAEVDQETNLLICGNKNALQKSVFDNLRISSETRERLRENG